MTFILQKDVFSEDTEQDTEAIIRKHFPNIAVITDEDVLKMKPHTHRGPFRGSLTLASRLQRLSPWANALQWAPTFNPVLVSKDYYFLDAQSILNRGITRPTFIRPASGMKMFSGNVYTQESFQQEFNFFTKNKNVDPEIICMVASPVEILLEWRLVFIDNKFVSGCHYMREGELCVAAGVPESIVEFAKLIADYPYFRNVFEFVIDIGMTEFGPRLVEVNGFETASFYACDLDKIYHTWSKHLL